MSKSIVVDRIKVIAEMARQNVTCEEVAQKAGVGRALLSRKCARVKRSGVPLPDTLPPLWALLLTN